MSSLSSSGVTAFRIGTPSCFSTQYQARRGSEWPPPLPASARWGIHSGTSNETSASRRPHRHRRGIGEVALLFFPLPYVFRGAKHGRKAVLLRQLPGDCLRGHRERRVQTRPLRASRPASAARLRRSPGPLHPVGFEALLHLGTTAAWHSRWSGGPARNKRTLGLGRRDSR